MFRKLVVAAALLVILISPPEVQAASKQWMDCYPGAWIRDKYGNEGCIIDFEGSCMYCIVTVIIR